MPVTSGEPVSAVIRDQKINDRVMIHLRLKRSPRNPAIGFMIASVKKSDHWMTPMSKSFRWSSPWMRSVRRPNSARSAWWKKKAHESMPSKSHL